MAIRTCAILRTQLIFFSAERQVRALHVIMQERGRASTRIGLVLLSRHAPSQDSTALAAIDSHRQGSESGRWNLVGNRKQLRCPTSLLALTSCWAKVRQRPQPCPWPTKISWIAQLLPQKKTSQSQRAASKDRNYRLLSVPQFEDSTIETAETGGNPSTYGPHESVEDTFFQLNSIPFVEVAP